MSTKQIEGAFGIFIVGTIICCIASGRWLLNGELDIISTLASFKAENFAVGGGLTVPTGITAYWNAIATALTWDYPFLASSWLIFIKIPLWVISAGVVVGLIQMAIYVISALVGLVRSVIGY